MMQENYEFQKLFSVPRIHVNYNKLSTVLDKIKYIKFQNISQIEDKVFEHQSLNEIMVIDKYENENNKSKYFILCFDYKIIIIEKHSKDDKDDKLFQNILDKHDTFSKYFLFDNDNEGDKLFLKEFSKFSKFLNQIKIYNSEIRTIWEIITGSLSAFLIKKGHENAIQMHDNHLKEEFEEYQETIDFENNSYVDLAFYGIGSCGYVYLIYHFPTETIFIRKMPDYKQTKATITSKRERENYLVFESQKERYPYIPQYYGYIEDKSCKHLLIEYIEGKTLNNSEMKNLSLEEKYDIIFELLLTIRYFHSLGYIYRDLKLNNIIINHNKDAILIDFDRLIKFESTESTESKKEPNETSNGNSTENKIETNEFNSESAAPEKHKTYKSDIYSLGHIIRHILHEELQEDNLKSDINFICQMCLNEKEEDRPTISTLIYIFYIKFLSNTQRKSTKRQILVSLLEKYFIRSNELIDMFTLYLIYSEGLYIPKDDSKGNSYFNQIICKFNFIFYPNILFIEEEIFEYQKEGDLIIIDKYQKKNQNYFTLCFDYKIIMIKRNNQEKTDEDTLKNIIGKYPYFYKYDLQNNNIDNNKSVEIKYLFHKKILEFKIDDLEIQTFYDTISNCLSTFLINRAYHYLTNSENTVEKHYTVSLNETYNISKIIHYFLGSNQKDREVQFNLGLIYDKGKFIKTDINKAIHYYSLAANQNHPQAQLNLSAIYYEGKYANRDIKKAIHYLSLAANQNDPKAQFNLGVIYYEGKYVTRDINKAIHYYSLASNQNDPHAQFNLGLIYSEGKYVTRDINKAIHYYSLAANQNDPEAQLNLGFIYDEGKYVTCDINKAIHYYSLAANQNNPKAQYNLGLIYSEGKYVTRDINKAIHYYSLAANQNDPQAQFNLGFIYSEGKYVTHDINKAIHYFSLAANQNDPQAQYNLGLIYYEGEYVARDINKAIHYYSLAANQNDPKAQYNLGLIYNEGKYVTRDINKAIHYYSLAANQNDPQAQFNLGLIYYEGEYVARDINKAILYFSLAANQNIPEAQYNLGLIYTKGEYVTVDINKAINYFTLAAKQNLPQAQFILGLISHAYDYSMNNIDKAIQYYSLAANQNDPQAQFQLGFIYFEGKYITRDISKAIHYFSLAANKNNMHAQFYLGFIYSEGKYVAVDIYKAIHYFSLAANQNYPQAQCNLGLIYFEGKYVTRDINKAIHYFSLAANQNIPEAQYNLGLIYSEGKYVTVDIDKAIHYYSLAVNQNIPQAQLNLGAIYHEGKYVTRDINKAIHYYSLAASKNMPQAQFNLGLIYSEGKYVTRDINKAIHYFSLAANQNLLEAQNNLGLIYAEGKYVTEDIHKAIHYFSLAANQNNSQAQYTLGLFYHIGKYIKQDINKAIHYYSLAANQNYTKAQLKLGIIYYNRNVQEFIKKGRFYIMLASKNGNREANFAHGFLLHEGKNVERNIEKAIHYYKEASSFNIQYAKNNLGVIYRHGYDKYEGRAGNAIVYFEEAIRQKNDFLSMYNLAHIHIYDETIKQDINKSIELLIRSSNNFNSSLILLCIASIKQFGTDIDRIQQEIKKRTGGSSELFTRVIQYISEYNLLKKSNYEYLYDLYRNEEFLYDINYETLPLSDLEHINKPVIPKYPKAKNISAEFYEGFGKNIINSW